jgi:hypothetical protein
VLAGFGRRGKKQHFLHLFEEVDLAMREVGLEVEVKVEVGSEVKEKKGKTDHNIRLRLLDSLPHRFHVLCISSMDYRVALFQLFNNTADKARGTLGGGVACALCMVIFLCSCS